MKGHKLRRLCLFIHEHRNLCEKTVLWKVVRKITGQGVFFEG